MQSLGIVRSTLAGITAFLIGVMQFGAVTAADEAQVLKGEELFGENCIDCHQEKGRGRPGVAPSLTGKEFLSVASDEFLTATIRDGRTDTNMAAFGEYLSTEEINALVVYLRSMSILPDRSKAVEAELSAMGDPRLGRLWFNQICAGCHGPNGEGYEEEGSGTAIGKASFLNIASDGFLRAIIRNGRSNSPMRGLSGPAGLANLSDQEIDDIISYMRTLPGK